MKETKGSQITFIQTPDGNLDILYINGKKEVHSELITGSGLIRFLEDYLPIKQMETKELTWDACNRLEYEFPDDLSEYHHDDFRTKD